MHFPLLYALNYNNSSTQVSFICQSFKTGYMRSTAQMLPSFNIYIKNITVHAILQTVVQSDKTSFVILDFFIVRLRFYLILEARSIKKKYEKMVNT